METTQERPEKREEKGREKKEQRSYRASVFFPSPFPISSPFSPRESKGAGPKRRRKPGPVLRAARGEVCTTHVQRPSS